MATTRYLSGYAYNKAGVPQVGLTVNCYNAATGGLAATTVTVAADWAATPPHGAGYWQFAGLDDALNHRVDIIYSPTQQLVRTRFSAEMEAMDVAGSATIRGVVKLANGSAAAPSLAFTADPDTGGYRAADGTFGVASNGVAAMRVGAGLLSVNAIAPLSGPAVSIPNHPLTIINTTLDDYALIVRQERTGWPVAQFVTNAIVGERLEIDGGGRLSSTTNVGVKNLSLGFDSANISDPDFGDTSGGGVLRLMEREEPVNNPINGTVAVWYDYAKLTLGLKRSDGGVIFLPTISPLGAVSMTSLTLSGTLGVTGVSTLGTVVAASGTLAAPGYTFSGDLDSGLMRNGSNQVSLVAGGQQVATAWMNGANSQFASYAVETFIQNRILIGGSMTTAASVTSVIRKIEIRDSAGNAVGWVPVYGAAG